MSVAPLLAPDTPAADLARTCIHEHGHLVVAQSLGAAGFVRLMRIAAATPGEAAGYAGSFQLYGDLDEREWRVVALAGTLAEWIAEGVDSDAILLDRLRDRPDALPATDARLASGYDEEDVRDCAALLRRRWSDLADDARARLAALPPAP
jgi:hypothetical protein